MFPGTFPGQWKTSRLKLKNVVASTGHRGNTELLKSKRKILDDLLGIKAQGVSVECWADRWPDIFFFFLVWKKRIGKADIFPRYTQQLEQTWQSPMKLGKELCHSRVQMWMSQPVRFIQGLPKGPDEVNFYFHDQRLVWIHRECTENEWWFVCTLYSSKKDQIGVCYIRNAIRLGY